MLGKTLHIHNSSFTYIPNPTPDRWDRVSQSLIKILESYRAHVTEDVPGVARSPAIIQRLKDHADEILGLHYAAKSSSSRLYFLQALHMAVDDTDEILTAKARPSNSKFDDTSETGSDNTHDIARQERRREEVQDVLRCHIQEVIRLLHERDERTNPLNLHVPDRSPSTPSHTESRFEDIDMASPEDRQERFVEVYFSVIRPRVVHARDSTVDRRMSTTDGLRRRTPHGVDSPDPRRRSAETFVSIPEVEKGDEIKLAGERVSRDDLWCTLVFRMVCWLMLHDFDKNDVQIYKTELYGSRMPVYIA